MVEPLKLLVTIDLFGDSKWWMIFTRVKANTLSFMSFNELCLAFRCDCSNVISIHITIVYLGKGNCGGYPVFYETPGLFPNVWFWTDLTPKPSLSCVIIFIASFDVIILDSVRVLLQGMLPETSRCWEWPYVCVSNFYLYYCFFYLFSAFEFRNHPEENTASGKNWNQRGVCLFGLFRIANNVNCF